jgi:hypothetical protein
MKRPPLVLIVIIFIIPILICACGEDGEDGKAYLALDWVAAPNWYNDDNPGTPPSGYRGVDYESEAGTYSISYEAWDGSRWSGTYKITVDKGEDGQLFSDGDDGEDSYFTLCLYSIGPSFYDFGIASEEEDIVASKGIIIDDSSELYEERLEDMNVIEESDSEMRVIEKRQGRYKMRIEYFYISQ